MIVNKKLKALFEEIADKSIEYANTPDKKRKYLKRLLHVYKNTLSEEEQIFILKLILEHIHYRSIITDPDNIIQIHNLRLRTITYVFILTVALILIIAFVFNIDSKVSEFIKVLGNIVELLSLSNSGPLP